MVTSRCTSCGSVRPVAAQRVERPEGGGDPRLAVEVAGVDVPAVGHDRQRVEGDEVADLDAERAQVVGVGAALVDPHLDVLPAHGLGVDLVAVGVAAGHQRQDRAGVGAVGVVGEDRDPAALGEAGAVRADRHDREPTVVLEVADHAPDRVGVGHDRPGAARQRPGRRGQQRAPPGERQLDGQVDQHVAEQLHDRVGAARRAGGAQQLQEEVERPLHVDLGQTRHGRRYRARPRDGHTAAGRRSDGGSGRQPQGSAGVVGNSRSMKRSAVGCGSWLASPGRSLASMNTPSGPASGGHEQVEPGHGDAEAPAAAHARVGERRGAARR